MTALSDLSTRRSVAVIARLERPGLGDLLQRNIGLALLRAACPDARITLYLSEGLMSNIGAVARPHLLIDDLEPCPEPGSSGALPDFVAELSASGHDLVVIDVDSADVSPRCLEAAGIRDVVALAAAADEESMNLPPGRYQVTPGRPPVADLVDHAWGLAEALGLPPPSPASVVPRLPFTEVALPSYVACDGDAPTVVIHPGGAVHWHRRWPARHFVDLVNRLIAWRAATVVLVGGPADHDDLAELVARSDPRHRERVHVLAGESLDAVATVMSRAELFVGNDSSMSHVAAALGLRCLVVAGPSHGDYLWGRAYPSMRTLTLSFPCRGLDERALAGDRSSCEHRCPLRYTALDDRGPECLEQLGVDLVWRSVESALRGSEAS